MLIPVNMIFNFSWRGGSLSLMWRRRFRGGGQREVSAAFHPSKPARLVSGSLKFLLSSPHFSALKPQFLPQATCWLMSTCSASPPLFNLHSVALSLSLSVISLLQSTLPSLLSQEDTFLYKFSPCVFLAALCFPLCHSFSRHSFLHPGGITINCLWQHISRQSSLIFVSFHSLPTSLFFFLWLTFLSSVSAPSPSTKAC